MYKINDVTQGILDEHFDRYAATTKTLMAELLNGTAPVLGELGTRHKISITYKVRIGSPTYLFLDKYSQDANLRKLLCGSWSELLDIISDVEGWIANLEWQDKATKAKYDNGDYQIDGQDANGRVILDHFNEIMRWLFVDNLYDSLDKLNFIEKLGLKICPYCGRQQINVAKFVERRDSKPPIDHFLPKSLYPFFAISFINMVPCCSVCNGIDNKGNFDPLKPVLVMHNPYVFDDASVTFLGGFDVVDKLDESSYDVDIACNPLRLEEGYNKILKLKEFYKQERHKVRDMHNNFTTVTDMYKDFLNNLSLKREFLEDNASLIIGHRLDDNASKVEFYKFKRDLFIQLLNIYGMA